MKYSSHGHSSNTSKQSCEDNPWQRLKRFCYTSFERSQLVNFSQKENYQPMYFVYKCLNDFIEFDFGFKSFKNRHDYNTVCPEFLVMILLGMKSK